MARPGDADGTATAIGVKELQLFDTGSPVEQVPGEVGGDRARRRCRSTLGTPASFGAFTPGVAREYSATHDRERDLDGG